VVAATDAYKGLLGNAQRRAGVFVGAIESGGAFDLFQWRFVHFFVSSARVLITAFVRQVF
jgi:hypothetical protein